MIKTNNKSQVNKNDFLDKASVKVTSWIGTPASIIVHTILFIVAFSLPFFGISFELVLLFLTTIVSLEAIYLALFIQMTVNRNTESLEEVEEDIEEIQEDVEDLGEDVEDIQEDIEEIQEDELEEDQEEKKMDHTLDKLQEDMVNLMRDIDLLKKQKKQ